jgi:hypothetical protein
VFEIARENPLLFASVLLSVLFAYRHNPQSVLIGLGLRANEAVYERERESIVEYSFSWLQKSMSEWYCRAEQVMLM